MSYTTKWDMIDADAINKLASDVKSIRARVDIFYQMAIIVIVVLVLRDVLDWFGM